MPENTVQVEITSAQFNARNELIAATRRVRIREADFRKADAQFKQAELRLRDERRNLEQAELAYLREVTREIKP